MSVLITARIPKELKEELKKYGINISQVVRKALEEAVYKKKLEELRRYQEITRKMLMRIGKDQIAKVIREIRDEA